MLYRHQEILRALADNTDGLTTAQLVKECRSKPGSEIPATNSTSMMSNLVYSLRAQKLLTSSDTGGTKVHKITTLGATKLAEAESEESSIKPSGDPVKTYGPEYIQDLATASEQEQEQAWQLVADDPDPAPEPDQSMVTLDPNNELENSFITIIKAFKDARETPPPVTIERKDQKINVLQRLSAMMSDDIRFVLSDIAADLEKLDAA